MEAMEGPQFSPHGAGWYQRPLPGMEKMGDKELPVRSLFHHDSVADENGMTPHDEIWWNLTRNYNPVVRNVRTASLRPSQPHVEESYLYSAATEPHHVREMRARGDHETANKEMLPAILNVGGRNIVMDGHHRATRAMLDDKKTMKARVWTV